MSSLTPPTMLRSRSKNASSESLDRDYRSGSSGRGSLLPVSRSSSSEKNTGTLRAVRPKRKMSKKEWDPLKIKGPSDAMLSPRVKRTGVCSLDGEMLSRVTLAYFASGPTALAKARRSAKSAKMYSDVETILITDEACSEGFDKVELVTLKNNGTEFVGYRPMVGGGALGMRSDEHNEMISSLRSSKIEAVKIAMKVASTKVLIFLDADTLVCRSLLYQACSVLSPKIRDTAFVPVPRDKWQATRQMKSMFKVTRATPQAETGALVFYLSNTTSRLVSTWARFHDELKNANPPQLSDALSFRAAVHATKADFQLLEPVYHCKGTELGCDGLPPALGRDTYDEGVTGNDCDVLHSTEVTVARGPFKNTTVNLLDTSDASCVEHYIDIPFASGNDVQIRDALRAALKDARSSMIRDIDPDADFECPPSKLLNSSQSNLARAALVLREPIERLLAEYEACCNARGGEYVVEWCTDAVPHCPVVKPGIEELGEAIATYAESRKNVYVKALKGILLLRDGDGAAAAAASRAFRKDSIANKESCGTVPVSRADERVVSWRLTTEFTLVGSAEHPRETVEVALRGSSRRRKRRDVTVPPPRSPLRAELSDAHLQRVRKAMILDRHLHKIANARFQGDLEMLRNNYAGLEDDERAPPGQFNPEEHAQRVAKPFQPASVQNYFRR